MKTLLLLRHGKSKWSNDDLADHERPLKKRGRRDSERIGLVIREEDIIPDIIYCSTAKRAKDTARIVAETSGFDREIILSQNLYHGYSDDFIDLLSGLKNDVRIVMIIGHNPGLEEFLSMLIDDEEWLPTAALAKVGLKLSRWAELAEHTQGELLNIWRPRDLYK